MNGDRMPDLVVTDECGSTSTVGMGHWLVYLNTGSGFASTGLTWTLPAGTYTSGLAHVDNCNNYGTVDMNGDQKPDLVVTDECGSTSTVGASHWLVHLNTGSGFASPGVMWTLPAGGFSRLAYGEGCSRYGTVDMNGDQKPDLVATMVCGSGSGVGTSFWQVYLNTGSAFATSPLMWTLPPGGFDYGLAYGGTCGTRHYGTVDMNGDQRPDLVVTSECGTGNGSVGVIYWHMYQNTGSAFSTSPVMWTLPAGGFEYGLAYGSTCGTRRYGTADINGDQRPDLVVTSDCVSGTSVGRDRWLVHLNTCP
jgi:hypothetical protein